jgi:8-amino-7-oxononanoate synthase
LAQKSAAHPLEETVKKLISSGLYPMPHVFENGAEPSVIINGKEYLLFASNNYLGLTHHPKVIAAAKDALDKYGTGTGASRLIAGTFEIHKILEAKIAKLKGNEDCVLFPSGYATNVGVISSFLSPLNLFGEKIAKSIVFSDEFNHASIIDGCRASNAEVVVYKHTDLKDLEEKLEKFMNADLRGLIVTDGIFSMDGDIAPLPGIAELAKKHHCTMMVDEAHSTGVLGVKGAGTVEHFNLKGQIELDMGTCSKALGANGGYIVTNKYLANYFRIAARSYMFSTSLNPVSTAAIIAGLDVVQEEPNLRARLIQNGDKLRSGLKRLGFNTLTSVTQIIPILFGSDSKAIAASKLFFEAGIIAPNVRWPAVPRNSSRIRLVVMSQHTPEQIDRLLNVSESVGKKLGII